MCVFLALKLFPTSLPPFQGKVLGCSSEIAAASIAAAEKQNKIKPCKEQRRGGGSRSRHPSAAFISQGGVDAMLHYTHARMDVRTHTH